MTNDLFFDGTKIINCLIFLWKASLKFNINIPQKFV